MSSNEQSLEDVDPLFSKSKKAGTSEDFYVQEDNAGPKLEDVDDIFKDVPKATSSTTTTPSAAKSKKESVDTGLAGVTGAAVGYVAGKVKPTEWKAPNTATATANVAAAEARVQSLKDAIDAAKNKKSPIATDIMKQLEGAQAVLEQKLNELNAARQEAGKFGITSVETPVVEGSALPGDKWSTKIVGSMGPGGDSVTEAARNYRLQQSLSPEEAAKFRAARSGIFVPNSLENVESFFSKPMSAAHDLLAKAQNEYENAQKQVLALKSALEKAVGPSRIAQLSNALDNAQAAVNSTKARLTSLASQAPPGLVRAGQVVSKIPFGPIAAGALAGYDAAQAANDISSGNYTEAAMHGLGATSGALMATPNYYAKGVGAALAVPPLAYEGYKYYKERQANKFDPGSGSDQSWD